MVLLLVAKGNYMKLLALVLLTITNPNRYEITKTRSRDDDHLEFWPPCVA